MALTRTFAVEDVFAFIVSTASNKPGHRSFWFSRKDMSDIKPIKVDAENQQKAWERLKKLEKTPCSTSS